MLKLLCLLGVSILPLANSLCLVNQCSDYAKSIERNNTIKNACAVIFDENCCKASAAHHVIKKGESGSLCKGSITSGLRGAVNAVTGGSGCKGPTGLNDDVESTFVLPGCTLEVWDESEGLDKAIKAERESKNAGLVRNLKDIHDGEKLSLTAFDKPNWIEELNDDFDDLNEDISSFRCNCYIIETIFIEIKKSS